MRLPKPKVSKVTAIFEQGFKDGRAEALKDVDKLIIQCKEDGIDENELLHLEYLLQKLKQEQKIK